MEKRRQVGWKPRRTSHGFQVLSHVLARRLARDFMVAAVAISITVSVTCSASSACSAASTCADAGTGAPASVSSTFLTLRSQPAPEITHHVAEGFSRRAPCVAVCAAAMASAVVAIVRTGLEVVRVGPVHVRTKGPVERRAFESRRSGGEEQRSEDEQS